MDLKFPYVGPSMWSMCCPIYGGVYSLSHAYFEVCRSKLTLPTAEILSGTNARAFLVCGFLMKSSKKIYPKNIKKIVGAFWKLHAK